VSASGDEDVLLPTALSRGEYKNSLSLHGGSSAPVGRNGCKRKTTIIKLRGSRALEVVFIAKGIVQI